MIRKLSILLISIWTLNAVAAEMVVEMKHELTPGHKEILVEQHGVESIEAFSTFKNDYFRRLYTVRGDEEKLMKSELVKKIEKIHQFESFSIEPNRESQRHTNDPLLAYQWGYINQGQTVLKDKDDLHFETLVGTPGDDVGIQPKLNSLDSLMKKEIVVAVIDSGVDLNHPELRGKILKNLDECNENGQIVAEGDETEVPDNDNNQLHGDCMGWNFTAAKQSPEARFPIDDTGHGTHVAGIIAAKLNNNLGVSGFGPKIKILPIKVFGRSDDQGDARISMTDRLARGILYAVSRGADVINLSLGWPRSIDTNYLKQSIRAAVSSGTIVVSAAGNNNTNTLLYPCANHHVICVGAYAADGKMATFSNYGGYVDVLAPGDSILSLYPEEFTPILFPLIGYEIKNGTSQAAPFISGIMAVLKSAFPDADIDEIKSRLFLGAGNVGEDDAKWSLFGKARLAKSLDMKPAPMVKPIFKELEFIPIQLDRKKFVVDLRIKNFWQDASDVKIKVRLENPGLSLLQGEFSYETLALGQSALIRLAGDLTNENAENMATILVDIQEGDGEIKTYKHKIPVVRLMGDDADIKTLPINLEIPEHRLAEIRGGVLFPNIATVNDPLYQQDKPVYYLKRAMNGEGPKGIRMYFFEMKEEAVIENGKSIFLQDATNVLSVLTMDFNYDGELDFLIKSSHRVEGEDPYIQYQFLNKGLEPLYGNKSKWRFTPEVVVPNESQRQWMPFEVSGLGRVAIPVFSEIGRLPQVHQPTGAWDVPDLSVLNRVYVLVPQVSEEGISLQTQVLDHPVMIKEMRTQLGLNWNQNIAFIGLIAQSKQEFYDGKIKTYYSHGQGFVRTNKLVTFSGLERFEILEMPFSGLRVEQDLSYPLGVIRDNQSIPRAGNAFVGYLDETSFSLFQTRVNGSGVAQSSRQDVVYHRPYTDHVLGHIASFETNEGGISLFQTKSRLLAVGMTEEGTTQTTYPISRFSFLPGRVLNDLFFPIVAKADGKNRPALYIDRTQISGNRIQLLVASKIDEITAPIKYSLLIPNNCRAMNPVPTEKGGHFSYAMLCKFNGNNWALKTISLK